MAVWMISSKTKILGLFAYPIGHSLSPLMQNAAIKKMGLDYVYVPFEVKPQALENAVDSIRALGISGVNVTIPHKQNVMKYLDKISGEAAKIGAVNTIINKDGVLSGYNTDYYGFTHSIEEKISLKNKNVFMLGCGGVSKAIALALVNSKIKKLVVSDIDIKKVKELLSCRWAVSKIEFVKTEESPCLIEKSDIFINATPVGMRENDPSPINKKLLRKEMFVYDVVYNRETQLLKDAGKIGANFISGLNMLVYQGAKSLELWTGKKPPVDLMRDILKEALND
ncbi:MAG: shikimate dehydrogenase [Elusimicrobia bacterium]|nr:shikimate dehydrogenase [Elusimicrobiota bacterium]